MAVIQDPTGAVFNIWQPKSHQGLGVTAVPGTLCWADLSTPNVEGAKPFYESLFGWKISPGEKDTSGYLHIQNGEQFIGGIPPAQFRSPNAPPHWLLSGRMEKFSEVCASHFSAGSPGHSRLRLSHRQPRHSHPSQRAHHRRADFCEPDADLPH